ncbi:MAG: PP2C family protein-serine/threonine phosphatase [Bacteroidia bacterium]
MTDKLFQTKPGTNGYLTETTISLKQKRISRSDELTDSIIYAKRIQEGMMLKEKHLLRLFPSSFILFKPKDIVSGDFYWFTKLDNKIIIAVADCTGHGIPGAFMSVLGINLMNQIVIEERNTDVSFILQRLDHKLKKAFDYSNDFIEEEKRPFDGMDISICCIDYAGSFLTFAGAQRPLYHLSKNDLNILEGSHYPIGGMNLETSRRYESQSVIFYPGDKLYLFSDGYPDQFGGPREKKFMTKNFRNVLMRTSRFSMQTQQLELERIFSEWQNNTEQTDDVLLVGLEL